MSFKAIILSVLIASPGDTREARDQVEKVIRSWNTDRARASKVVLLPLRWETDATSELGAGDAQEVINRQLVDEADIVVGIFHGRLGRPTGRTISGTAEELERGILRKLYVHVYFSEMPLPRTVDPEQLAAVNRFRNELGPRGLLGTFASNEDLASQVRTALEKDVARLVDANNRSVASAAKSGAMLRATCRWDERTPALASGEQGRALIDIENIGSAAAEELCVSLSQDGSGDLPINRLDEFEPRTINPGAKTSYPVYLTTGSGTRWQVNLTWNENGRGFSEQEILTL